METRLPAASSALTRDEGDSPRSDDLFFREAKVEPILKTLNGRKHLIVGNHDHTWMKRVEASDYFRTVLEYPHFLTPEMSRMPDFIGRNEFLEVK